MAVSEQTYRQVLTEDPEGQWELHDGRLREKPPMSTEHNDVIALLGHILIRQLDRREFRVRVNAGRVRRTERNVFIPDVFVVPTALERRGRGRPGTLEVYAEPLPLVVEGWSPSTGDYDIDQKLPVYRERGDREIWRIHPFERTLLAAVRQPDGSYAETSHGPTATVRLSSLPDVAVDLPELFAD